METCFLGTPFPRSALFLGTLSWKWTSRRKGTEGLGYLVTTLMVTKLGKRL